MATSKFIAPSAIALLATATSPALAAPATSQFSHEGETYVYTVANAEDSKVIDGSRKSDGARFHLVVRNGRVSGSSNGRPVAFRLADARGATGHAKDAVEVSLR